MSRTRRATAVFLMLTCVAVCTSVWGQGAVVWTPDTGEVDIEKLPRDTPLRRFAYGRALAGAGKHADAIRELKALVKRYPDEIFVEQAEEAIIICYWQNRKYKKAFRACGDFLKNYPASYLVSQVEALRLDIAVDLSVKSPGRAIYLLELLLETSKFEEQSARCLRYLGDCNYRLKRYDDARDYYKELIEDYPKSQWVPYAFYRMALCNYRQGFRELRDFGLIRQAIVDFREYQEEFGKTDPRPKAEKYLKKLKEFDAVNHLEIARFYEKRRKKPKAAAIYLQRLLALYPDTGSARVARFKLRELEEKVIIRPEQAVREVPF